LELSISGGDDGVGVGAPDEGSWVLVVLGEKAVDGGLQVDDHRCVRASRVIIYCMSLRAPRAPGILPEHRNGEQPMTVKQTTSYTDEAFAFARELVEDGEFGSISAAASAALLRMKRARDAEARLLEAEVLRRAQLPPDQYVAWRPGLLLDAYDRAGD